MTSVCSVGLDMIAIPGDTPPETIAAIIADEMAIGVVNDKTTAVRLIPVPGAKAGDVVDFGGLFGATPVMEVRNSGASDGLRPLRRPHPRPHPVAAELIVHSRSGRGQVRAKWCGAGPLTRGHPLGGSTEGRGETCTQIVLPLSTPGAARATGPVPLGSPRSASA